MLIDQDVINKIRDSVGELLETYSKEMNVAMDDADGVDISLPVKVRQNGPKLDVQVGIGFVKTRIKDSVLFTVSSQKELFGDEGIG
jgi:hypothetical protein